MSTLSPTYIITQTSGNYHIHSFVQQIFLNAYDVSVTVTGPGDKRLTKQRLYFWDLADKEKSSCTKY